MKISFVLYMLLIPYLQFVDGDLSSNGRIVQFYVNNFSVTYIYVIFSYWGLQFSTFDLAIVVNSSTIQTAWYHHRHHHLTLTILFHDTCWYHGTTIYYNLSDTGIVMYGLSWYAPSYRWYCTTLTAAQPPTENKKPPKPEIFNVWHYQRQQKYSSGKSEIFDHNKLGKSITCDCVNHCKN